MLQATENKAGLEFLHSLPKDVCNLIEEYVNPDYVTPEEDGLRARLLRTYRGTRLFCRWVLYARQKCLYFVADDKKVENNQYLGGSTLWKVNLNDLPKTLFKGLDDDTCLTLLKFTEEDFSNNLKACMPYSSKVLSFKDRYKILDFDFSRDFSSIALLMQDSDNDSEEERVVQRYRLSDKKLFYHASFKELGLVFEGCAPCTSITTNGKDILLNIADPSHISYSTYFLKGGRKAVQKIGKKGIPFRVVSEVMLPNKDFAVNSEESECTFVDYWDDCANVLCMDDKFYGDDLYNPKGAMLQTHLASDFRVCYDNKDSNGYFDNTYSINSLPYSHSPISDNLLFNYLNEKTIFTKEELGIKSIVNSPKKPSLKKQRLENK